MRCIPHHSVPTTNTPGLATSTWEKGMCEEETATESTKNHQPAPKKAPANEGPHRRPCSRLRQCVGCED